MTTYKLYIKSGIFAEWVFFLHKVENGISMIKTRDNSSAKWQVGNIPNGAIIV